jgi:hypothetical protein
VKEHIKDYGHYGPHSANERPRRPGKLLSTNETIKAVFEEWTLELNGKQNEHSQPRRRIQSCEYDAPKTKLWHEDVTGELYLRGNSVEDDVFEGGSWHQCLVADCYYQILSPEGLGATVFKTAKGLLEHCRRSHELSSEKASLASHLQSHEGAESGSSWVSTDFTDMSKWHNIYYPESGTPFWGDQERLFEVEEEFLGLGQQQQSQTWETADIQHSDGSTLFPTIAAAALAPLPPPTTSSSINRSDSWVSMSYSYGGDNGTFISSSSTGGASLARSQSTEPSTG